MNLRNQDKIQNVRRKIFKAADCCRLAGMNGARGTGTETSELIHCSGHHLSGSFPDLWAQGYLVIVSFVF